MRRAAACLLVLLLWGISLWAVELRFEPRPRLLETFQIVLEGGGGKEEKVVLFNATTGQRWVVELKRDGPVLKSPPLQVVRSCDTPKAGAIPIEVTQVGELLVVATDVACGLSAVAKVEPREGRCQVFLEVKEGEEWKPAAGLGAGEHRVRIVYPPADRTCDPDPLPQGLKVRLGSTELLLSLVEDAPSSGAFTWDFSGAFKVDREGQRLLFVMKWGDQSVEVPECTTVVFQAADCELAVRIQLLSVEIKPATALLIPLGCQAKLWLSQPEDPDEVLWWVPGRGWFSGPSLEFVVDEPLIPGLPRYPEALLAKAFVRKGAAWGTCQAALSLIPRPKLLFLDANTGEEITGAWPSDQDFKLRVTDVVGWPDHVLAVRMGKLGPHPRERTVELRQIREGVYESEPLNPRLWQAQAGEFLWAQICYPEPIECVISVLLPLR